jgi:redox-sensitive bicupin YhaK (pirin superfamily)
LPQAVFQEKDEMSDRATEEPHSTDSKGSVELVIEPKLKDLGEFTVRRVLPAPERRMVGSFIFFDHMGPAEFPPGQGIQVRPHPHIGIATVTYLFEGEIMHRDDLGYVQPIQRGAVNLMTAGSGIVHSERAGDDLNETSRLHGIQSWMALPDGEEEREPAFRHYPASDLPTVDVNGVSISVIMGEAYGHESPVHTYSSTLYLECVMPEGTELTLPDQYPEIAAYVVAGSVTIDGQSYGEGVMAVGCAGTAMTLIANEESRVMVVGGEPLGKRHIYWNFVSSSKERIEQAKSDWREGKFGKVPGEHEFIPLPD